MSKRVRMALTLTVVLMLAIPQLVAAADLDWQINWQDDGSLREEVRIVQGVDIVPAASDWQLGQEGEKQLLSRQIQDWSSYKSLPDGLPLEVKIREFLIWQQAEIKVNPNAGTGLWSKLDDTGALHLTIYAPGIIIANSAQQQEESWATWDFSDSAALLQAGTLARVINVDGLLLGIVIFLIGLLWIGTRFIKQLKKAEQIIAEEYTLQADQSDSSPPPTGQD